MSPNDTPRNLIQYVLKILYKTDFVLIKLWTFKIGNRLRGILILAGSLALLLRISKVLWKMFT